MTTHHPTLPTPVEPNADFQPEVYAIDFGTSNSLLVAANPHGVTTPVPIDGVAHDPTILRSILYFQESEKRGSMLFGAEALQAYADAGMQGRFLRSLKRFLPDPGFSGTSIGTRRYSLEELIAAMLRAMRERANATFQRDVKRVLLGRPARYSANDEFDALAQQRMRMAATLAGFEEVDFFAEPVAAARDFDLDLQQRRLVLIVDLGGGTSDFSVVWMDNHGFQPNDVLATTGVSVAGDALDGALMRKELSRHFGSEARYKVAFGNNVLTMPAVFVDMLCTPAKLPLLQARDVQQFLKEVRTGALTKADRELVERFLVVAEDALGFSIFEAVEQVKRELSAVPNTEFRYEYSDISINHALSRERFEVAVNAPVTAIAECLDETLRLANVAASEIELVCLTGGTSRVPVIQRQLSERFGAARIRRLKGLHSVVQGLGYEAYFRQRSALE
jgi:hypothetical chaperone protein